MLKVGHSLSKIARTIGNDISSVGGHVAAYGGRDGYDVREMRRRKRMKRIAAMDSIHVMRRWLLQFVTGELKRHKSPEQISGILSLKKKVLAASAIY